MNEKSRRKSRAFVVISLVILCLAILTVDTKRRGEAKNPAAYFLPALSYLQKGTTKTWRSTRDFVWSIFGSRHLLVENRNLKQEVRSLEERISQLREYERENEELRKLLQFRKKTKLEEILAGSIGAEVMGRNPSNWYRTLVIDRGERGGLKRNMVVVSREGLVGRITEVGFTTSQVMLILDEESCVSAIVERTKEHGIVEGKLTDALRMKYLSGKTEVMPGDVVYSSGLGGIYPKGILIGRVKGVKRADYGLTMSAEVEPAVDFSRLENVLVLK